MEIKRKLEVFAHAKVSKNISKTCRYYGITRETFYKWKRLFDSEGPAGLISKKPGAKKDFYNQIPKELEEREFFT